MACAPDPKMITTISRGGGRMTTYAICTCGPSANHLWKLLNGKPDAPFARGGRWEKLDATSVSGLMQTIRDRLA
jgi:hypothetical protein